MASAMALWVNDFGVGEGVKPDRVTNESVSSRCRTLFSDCGALSGRPPQDRQSKKVESVRRHFGRHSCGLHAHSGVEKTRPVLLKPIQLAARALGGGHLNLRRTFGRSEKKRRAGSATRGGSRDV